MTVRELLGRIDSREFTEWIAYSTIEPFGEGVADYRHGIAVAALANINRDHKARRDPFTPEDFIPWHDTHRETAEVDGLLEVDPQAQAALIKNLFRRHSTG